MVNKCFLPLDAFLRCGQPAALIVDDFPGNAWKYIGKNKILDFLHGMGRKGNEEEDGVIVRHIPLVYERSWLVHGISLFLQACPFSITHKKTFISPIVLFSLKAIVLLLEFLSIKFFMSFTDQVVASDTHLSSLLDIFSAIGPCVCLGNRFEA